MKKQKFKTRSALENAPAEMVDAIGKAMIVFGAIEGAVNFNLAVLIKNEVIWRNLFGGPISQRLTLFGDLLAESGAVSAVDVKSVIDLAKKCFEDRNLIAHNPYWVSSDDPVPKIQKMGAKKPRELAAVDILKIAKQADEIYNEIHQLFGQYQHFMFNRAEALNQVKHL